MGRLTTAQWPVRGVSCRPLRWWWAAYTRGLLPTPQTVVGGLYEGSPADPSDGGGRPIRGVPCQPLRRRWAAYTGGSCQPFRRRWAANTRGPLPAPQTAADGGGRPTRGVHCQLLRRRWTAYTRGPLPTLQTAERRPMRRSSESPTT